MLLIKKEESQVLGSSEFCGGYNKVLEGGEYSINIVIFKNISNTTPHYHTGFDEIYMVMEGEIQVTTYEPETQTKKVSNLKADELILIGKNIHHQITMTSERNRLIVICNPPYNEEDIHPSKYLLSNECGLPIKVPHSTLNAINEEINFCQKIEGFWWQRIAPGKIGSAISLFNISFDKQNLKLHFRGRSYDVNANLVAHWEAETSNINHKDRKFTYVWTGGSTLKPGDLYRGDGVIELYAKGEEFKTGEGNFTSINMSDLPSTTIKTFQLKRTSEDEINVINSHDKEQISSLIRRKIEDFS